MIDWNGKCTLQEYCDHQIHKKTVSVVGRVVVKYYIRFHYNLRICPWREDETQINRAPSPIRTKLLQPVANGRRNRSGLDVYCESASYDYTCQSLGGPCSPSNGSTEIDLTPDRIGARYTSETRPKTPIVLAGARRSSSNRRNTLTRSFMPKLSKGTQHYHLLRKTHGVYH